MTDQPPTNPIGAVERAQQLTRDPGKQLPLPQRLRQKASMIQLGEVIDYHSEVTLMIEAANRLEQLERLLARPPCP